MIGRKIDRNRKWRKFPCDESFFSRAVVQNLNEMVRNIYVKVSQKLPSQATPKKNLSFNQQVGDFFLPLDIYMQGMTEANIYVIIVNFTDVDKRPM